MIRAATLLLACANFVQAPHLVAAPINITLTNKGGDPRTNLEVRYDVDGIIVENPRATPVRLLTNQPATTNDSTAPPAVRGRFTIDSDVIDAQLKANASTLLNSKQVTITIRPFSYKKLVEVELKLLLGSVSQDLKVVMMKLPSYRVLELTRAVYTGSKGTFHLAGTTGTAFYSTRHSGRRWLTALNHEETHEKFLIYRELDAPRQF